MGRKAAGRRGRRDEWDEGSPSWVRTMQACRSGAGLGGDAVASNALQWWLMQAAGRASLMVLTPDEGLVRSSTSEGLATAAATRDRPRDSPLRQVYTRAEMLSAVRLCEDAFTKAGIYMGEDFWRYGPDDEPTTDVEAMPYLEATACHAEMWKAGQAPMRQYYLYTEPNGVGPTAAIVVEVLCAAIWVVGLMGSSQAGHGRRALSELQRLAFTPETGKVCHAIVLEALDGATMNRKRLVEFYESCGFEHCGNTPSHLNGTDSAVDRAELAERLYGVPAFPGGSFSAESVTAIELEVATDSPDYATRDGAAIASRTVAPMACDDDSQPQETLSPAADRPDEPEDMKYSEEDQEARELTSMSTPSKVSPLSKAGRSPSLVFASPDTPDRPPTLML